jgi:putative oxidoreductase
MMMPVLRLAARWLLAWVFLRAGTDVLKKPEPRAQTAGGLIARMREMMPFLPQDDLLLVRLNAGVQVVSAVLLALGMFRRAAALTLLGSLVPTTLGGHAYWTHDEPTRRAQQRIHFDKNVAIVGGLLAVALDDSGRRRRSW